MIDYYQKYLKYKKKYLTAKNQLSGASISPSPPGSPPRSPSVRSRLAPQPPRPKKKSRVNENFKWTSLYKVGEVVTYRSEYYKITHIDSQFDNLTLEDETKTKVVNIQNRNLIKVPEFNTRTVYLYGGCLCPPHKGHLELIKSKSQELKLNEATKVAGVEKNVLLVGLADDDLRHNFKTEYSKTIIEKYLKVNGIDNVEIGISGVNTYRFPQLDVLRLKMAKDLNLSYRDRIKVIVGADYITEDKIGILQEKMREAEQDYNLDLSYTVEDRDPGLSSTNFSKLLDKYKRNNINEEEFMKRLPEFIPEEIISDDEIIQILKK